MTTNPHKGDVSFEVEGKTYTLRYNHRALVKMETALNKGLMQVMTEMSKPETLRLGTTAVLLWAGLQKHHPQITQDQAIDMLDEIDGGVPAIIAFIDQAFGKAFETTLGTKGTNPPQEKAGNGTGTKLSSTMSPTDINLIPSGRLPQGN